MTRSGSRTKAHGLTANLVGPQGDNRDDSRKDGTINQRLKPISLSQKLKSSGQGPADAEIVFIGKTAGMKKYTVSPRNFESRDEAEISGGSLYRCR